ncbi:Fc.00g056530.m01.CDS01 [Cosmosporella sp. VM-42]
MAPMFPLFAETFSLSETEVPLITGVTVMVLGFSNFIVIPFSKIFGRRATALTFGVLFLVTCIWQAVAKSYGSFMAARAIIGITAAPSETLMVQVIADMFFIHERGPWMGVYFASVALGAFVGLVISGNIAARYWWRSFFWLSTGLIAFNLVLLFFLFPETRYDREQISPASSDVATPTTKIEIEADPTQHIEILDCSVITGKGRPSPKQYLLFQRPSPRF